MSSAHRLERFGLADAVLDPPSLPGLIARKPVNAAFEHAVGQFQAVVTGDLQTMDDQGCRVCRGNFAIAGKPTPAAVRELHVGQCLNAGAGHFCNFGLVENRVVLVVVPLSARTRAIRRVVGH